MKIKKLSKYLAIAAIGAAFALTLSACSSEDNGELETDTGLTGGIAATVNDVEIEEDKVTRAINNIRIRNDYTDEDGWKQYLTMYGYTVESMRYTILGQLIDEQLVRQCAEQLGVTTDDEEIQSYVEKMSTQYSSEDKWLEAVDKAGWDDEDAYKDSLRFSILQKKIQDIYEKQADEALNDKAALLEEVKEAISTYNGAKRSAHIQLGRDDGELAQEIYNKLSNGEISWNAAVEQYSTDEETKGSNGDKGWDSIEEYSTTYKNAVTGLSAAGTYAQPIQNKNGYEIITVTDIWNMPEEVTSLDQVPTEFVDKMRADAAEKNGEDLYEDWLSSVHASNTITVNPMPDNVPYYVDLSGDYTQEEMDEINEKAYNKLITGVEETAEEVTDVEAEADADQAALDDAEAAADEEGAADVAVEEDGDDHEGHDH